MEGEKETENTPEERYPHGWRFTTRKKEGTHHSSYKGALGDKETGCAQGENIGGKEFETQKKILLLKRNH